MPDNRFSCGAGFNKENVAIEVGRVLDSCKDRDCFENVRVFLTEYGSQIIERTNTVRVKDACISQTYIGLDSVPFNRGFYTVTIRFYVKLTLEACVAVGHSQEFDGIAVLEKKVILYGGESNVSVFKSSAADMGFCSMPEPCHCEKNLPTATVEVVDPIVLDVKIVEKAAECNCCCCCCDIPENVSGSLAGNLFDNDDSGRYLAVTLGIFSVVRITRISQYIINAQEYSIPDKECVNNFKDDPCSVFRTMAFPTQEFHTGNLPPLNTDKGGKCGCQGQGNNTLAQ